MKRKKPQSKIGPVLDDIAKVHGTGAAVQLGNVKPVRVEVIPTGSLTIDIATEIGGIPRGRITEVFGPEAGGKTTVCLQVCAEAQKSGEIAVAIDAEHALDLNYAAAVGVDIKTLVLVQPQYGEQALDIAERLIVSGQVGVVFIDSVANLVPKAEMEGEIGDTHVAMIARLMSQTMRKFVPVVHNSNTAVIFINQIREKVGVQWGNPETTPGGRALKFNASLRMDVRRIASLKVGEKIVGARTKVRVLKNKLASPTGVGEFDLLYGHGVSKEGEIVDFGEQIGLLEKSGAHYTLNGSRYHGREAAKKYLAENLDVAAELEAKIRKELIEKPGLN